MTQTEKAISFLEMVAHGDCDSAFENYVHKNFKHHNPYFPSDSNSLKTAMQENANQFPDKQLMVHQTIEEGNKVVCYSEMQHQKDQHTYSLCHIFLFSEGKIIEAWDIAQEVPKDSPNKLGAF